MTKAVSIPSNYRYAVMPLSGMISSIQKWYQSRYQTSLEENEITLLQGSQEALVNLPLIYCNPGDIVLVQILIILFMLMRLDWQVQIFISCL